jgi:LAO/AO transport system kinase
MPGGGDEIQAMKAGILEIRDIFCVNKADREGAPRAISELKMMLGLSGQFEEGRWRPAVMPTIALKGIGTKELVDTIEAHRQYLHDVGLLDIKLRERARAELLDIINRRVSHTVLQVLDEEGPMHSVLERMAGSRELDPHTAAQMVIEFLVNESAAGRGAANYAGYLREGR